MIEVDLGRLRTETLGSILRPFLSPSALGISLVGADDDIHLEFRRCPRLSLSDVAILALMARKTAEHRRVLINWPDSTTKEMRGRRKFLGQIGLEAILSRQADPWASRVETDGSLDALAGGDNYLPLRWIGAESFDPPLHGWWRTRQRLTAEYSSESEGFLRRHDVLSESARRRFLGTVLHEAGWNIVLHAESEPGAGIGAVCGFVHLDGTLEFCVADIGQGIPRSIDDVYMAGAPKRITDRQCGEPEKRVLFALTDAGTRRPEFPSKSDEQAYRGLHHLADDLGDLAEVTLRSGGAGIHLAGRPKGRHRAAALRARLLASPGMAGTQVSGKFRVIEQEERVLRAEDLSGWERDAEIVLLADSTGSTKQLAEREVLEKEMARVGGQQRVTVFDCAFDGMGLSLFQDLVKTAVRCSPASQCVFMNVTVEWPAMHHLATFLRNWLPAGTPAPIIIRSASDMAVIGAEATQTRMALLRRQLQIHCSSIAENPSAYADLSPTDSVIRCELSAQLYQILSTRINDEFVERGFRERSIENGFFEGRIHLLSLGERKRFLSVAVSSESAANRRRWADGLVTTILQKTTPRKRGSTVLLACAASMRAILGEVSTRLRRTVPHTAVLLLTFDLPNRAEIARVVSPGDEVFVLSDVVASASLIGAVRELVVRSGGHVAASVAIADARLAPAIWTPDQVIAWAHVREPASVGDDEWWVDPVSQVPSTTDLWRVPVDPRSADTVQLVLAADAAVCGHVVDGPRHTSLGIDLERLFERQGHEVVKRLVTALQDRLLSADVWRHFSPTHVLFPAGIGRLEVISPDTENRANPRQESRSASFYAMRFVREAFLNLEPLRVANESVKGRSWREVEVPRSFEPGGRSRCASIVPGLGPAKSETGHCVVVDDGMASGKTAIELVRIAARFGCTHVLVVAVLARMRSDEVTFWEGLRELAVQGATESVHVRFVFPLFLPVPYRDASECPYEETHRLLAGKSVSRETTAIAKRLQSVLEPRTSPLPDRVAPDFTHTWVRSLVLAELSDSNAEQLTELVELVRVERYAAPDRIRAVLTLFLEEWRILARPRLRQVLGPAISDLAAVAISEHPDHKVALIALALLRSRFPRIFVTRLRDLADNLRNRLSQDLSLLERLLFHIATLSEVERRSVNAFLVAQRALELHLPSLASNATDNETVERIAAARSMAQALCDESRLVSETQFAPSRGSTDLAEPIQMAMEFLRTNQQLRHLYRQQLTSVLQWPAIEAPSELLASSIAPLETVKEFFTSSIEPLLVRLERLQSDPEHQHYLKRSAGIWDYIATPSRASRELRSMIGTIDGVARGMHGRHHLNQMFTIARQIHEVFCNWDTGFRPGLYQLLQVYGELTVGQLVDALGAWCGRFRIGARGLDIGWTQSSGAVDRGTRLFCPPQLLEEVLANLNKNLLEYAFTGVAADVQPTLLAELSVSQTPNGTSVIGLNVANNGNPDITRRSKSEPPGMSLLSNRLAVYGGSVTAAVPTNHDRFRVACQLSLRLW